MILRLLADADLNGAVVSGTIRRNAELDFKRAEDVPLEGLDDDIVLDIAATEFWSATTSALCRIISASTHAAE